MTAAQRAKASVPAVVYALDAANGKELWNSGKTITSFMHGGGALGRRGPDLFGDARWDAVFVRLPDRALDMPHGLRHLVGKLRAALCCSLAARWAQDAAG